MKEENKMKCTKTTPAVQEPLEAILLIATKAKELWGLLKIRYDLIRFLAEMIKNIRDNITNREFFIAEKNMGLIKAAWIIENDLGDSVKNTETIEPTVAKNINNLLGEIKCSLDTECINFDADDPMNLIDYSKDNYMQIFKTMMS